MPTSKIDKILLELEKLLDIKFKNKELLKQAITHKSWAVENKIDVYNERLEFLGDSVLSLIVTNFLYSTFPQKNEGELSKIKSQLVSKLQLANWSKEFGLNKYFLVSSSEKSTGGLKKDTIAANMFEAILGAIFLDQGLKKAQIFLENNFLNNNLDFKLKDFKSVLQEIVQKKHKTLPIYEIVKETGPDHLKEFEAVVKVEEKILGKGKGKTKKEAEQAAAENAINSNYL